jgi:hypothetical protein
VSGGRRWGEWAWWAKQAGRLASQRGSGPHVEKEVRPGRWRFGPAGRPRPRRGGGGLRLGLGEGGIPREEVGEAGRPKAKAQVAGPKTGDGPKLKKKFILNFKLNLGIWLDIVKLHN